MSGNICAWPQLTHSLGVYFFTLLSRKLRLLQLMWPRWQGEWQGLHNQLRTMNRAYLFPLRIKIFLQNNIAHPEWVHKRLSTISVVTLGLKMLPFAISLPSSENSHLYNIHHLKRFVALLSDFFFFFCIELWFCCRMQNTSQGWQTNGEPVLDINLWFSGKTHSKCKSCYWEHIVMIHHVNICLAA